MGIRSKRHDEGVIQITGAPENVGSDIDHRQRRYILSMSIRTLCFIGAVFAVRIPWLCGGLIAASFLLPYVAVVIANSAAPRVEKTLLGPGVAPVPPGHELGSGFGDL